VVADARGYVLDAKVVAGRRVWTWRGGDERHPCFLTEREALTYMKDWLRRVAIFER
jgi:hypothetical protein